MSELRKIPNVGKTTEKDLIAMGYTTIESLKGKTAEQLYEEECVLRGGRSRSGNLFFPWCRFRLFFPIDGGLS